jgi:hypothetical protein
MVVVTLASTVTVVSMLPYWSTMAPGVKEKVLVERPQIVELHQEGSGVKTDVANWSFLTFIPL